MDLQETLTNIRNYRERDGNWYKLAKMVREVSRSEAWRGHFSSNAEWVKEAAKVSGYHAAVLRRMVRAIYFLEQMVNEGIVLKNEEEIPLASLEILERMYPLAQEKVKGLLTKALDGAITLREVQKEYDDAVRQQYDDNEKLRLFHKDSKTFKLRASKAILASIVMLSGKEATRIFQRIPSGFPFPISREMLIAAFSNKHYFVECDAYYPHFASTYESIIFDKSLLRSIMSQCEFFRRFWVVLPESIEMKSSEVLSDRLRELGLVNVGFALLNDKPESPAPEDLWCLTRSVYWPDILSPSDPRFFPPESEYFPRWMHLLLRHLC